MKKIILALVMFAVLLPAIFATQTGIGIGVGVSTEKFRPQLWMCGGRAVTDDNVEPGRATATGQLMDERMGNYAFEGEQISWKVLVLDKNGIEKVKDAYITVAQGASSADDIEANCAIDSILSVGEQVDPSCNARVDEEHLTTAYPNSMAYYTCTLTVESPRSMHGEYWITAHVDDLDNLSSSMSENEFWFLNPTVSLTIQGLPLQFGTVRPGAQGHSNTITIGNGAESNSGVMLDMFITGTDFYDPSHSGAKCPTTNQLSLANLKYFATNGAYSTQNDIRPSKDSKGYVGISYGNTFTQSLYDRAEIMETTVKNGPYYVGNYLSPGAEIAVTFQLSLPEPCNGDFSDGMVFFWGEAV